jgi:adenosylcobinamide-GDP ribazoletransferase
MKESIWQSLKQRGKRLISSFLAAVIFYTTIRIPFHLPLEFSRIARWSPLVGLLIGVILTTTDLILNFVGIPIFTRSVIIVAFWIGLTGGLHLDGVMDTADGLAVLDPQRRLQVMQDSVTGAFGVMAGVILLLLKIAALTDLSLDGSIGLILAAGWGRWGQVAAIAFYPYLKPTGKGAVHKQTIRLPQDIFLGLFLLWGVTGLWLIFHSHHLGIALGLGFLGNAIALSIGFWFYHQLGGHTGDTYGAVVEWTEALFLCCLTLFP